MSFAGAARHADEHFRARTQQSDNRIYMNSLPVIQMPGPHGVESTLLRPTLLKLTLRNWHLTTLESIYFFLISQAENI